MDHATAAQQHMTERYLLNELDPRARDEFEEHYFDCAQCASDVNAASLFIENSKVVWNHEADAAANEVAKFVPPTPKPNWLGWLRPAFAAPALALLLSVVGYDYLVVYPQMARALKPHVAQSAMVNIGTYNDSGPDITIGSGEGFVVNARITPQNGYSNYVAELYNPANKLEWSLTIPASASQAQWPIVIPGADRKPGTYILRVKGITPDGNKQDVGQGTFDLHITK
jgi:anti-sigma factor RsiW